MKLMQAAVRPLHVHQPERRCRGGLIAGERPGDHLFAYALRCDIETHDRSVDLARVGIKNGKILGAVGRANQLSAGVTFDNLKIGKSAGLNLMLEGIAAGPGHAWRPTGIAQTHHPRAQAAGERQILGPADRVVHRFDEGAYRPQQIGGISQPQLMIRRWSRASLAKRNSATCVCQPSMASNIASEANEPTIPIANMTTKRQDRATGRPSRRCFAAAKAARSGRSPAVTSTTVRDVDTYSAPKAIQS